MCRGAATRFPLCRRNREGLDGGRVYPSARALAHYSASECFHLTRAPIALLRSSDFLSTAENFVKHSKCNEDSSGHFSTVDANT